MHNTSSPQGDREQCTFNMLAYTIQVSERFCATPLAEASFIKNSQHEIDEGENGWGGKK